MHFSLVYENPLEASNNCGARVPSFKSLLIVTQIPIQAPENPHLRCYRIRVPLVSFLRKETWLSCSKASHEMSIEGFTGEFQLVSGINFRQRFVMLGPPISVVFSHSTPRCNPPTIINKTVRDTQRKNLEHPADALKSALITLITRNEQKCVYKVPSVRCQHLHCRFTALSRNSTSQPFHIRKIHFSNQKSTHQTFKMHSIIYTAATLLASLSALAAPAPAPASDIVVFGRYNTYSDTNCVDATQTGIILSGPQCRALPDNSVYADFDNEAGTHCKFS